VGTVVRGLAETVGDGKEGTDGTAMAAGVIQAVGTAVVTMVVTTVGMAAVTAVATMVATMVGAAAADLGT
jgi:hypothetical protein